ncbi:MAG: hypothetical protein PHC75_06705 [Burkholderiales bacterium]|nr:hypothetical protein [Burkholderiales bacterium]
MLENIIFKLLNGPLEGSSFDIEYEKVYKVGTNDDCEIYIESDVESLFSFIVKDNFLQFTSLAENAFLSEVILTSETYELPKIFTINNIKIGIGSSDNLNGALKVNDLIHDNTTSDNLVPDIDDYSLNQEEAVDSLDNQESGLSKTKPELNYFRNKIDQITLFIHKSKFLNKEIYNIRYYWLALIILVLILLISIRVLINIGVDVEQSIVKDKLNDDLKIKEKVAYILNSNHLMLNTVESNDVILVTGIVQTKEDVVFINRLFKTNDLSDHVKVIPLIYNDIESNLLQIMKSNQMQDAVFISFNNANAEVNIAGFTKNVDMIDGVSHQITEQYPNIENINYSNLFSLDDLVNSINIAIESFVLNKQIKVDYDLNHKSISISGYLDSSNKNLLVQSLAKVNGQYGELIDFVYDIKSPNELVPIQVIQISLSQPSYIVVRGGDVIFEGGQINGYTLSRITQKELFFTGKANFSISIGNTETYDSIDNNIDNKSDKRINILKEEAQKESAAISNYEYKVNGLKQILGATKDTQLKLIIEDEIQSVNNDLIEMRKNYLILQKKTNLNVN